MTKLFRAQFASYNMWQASTLEKALKPISLTDLLMSENWTGTSKQAGFPEVFTWVETTATTDELIAIAESVSSQIQFVHYASVQDLIEA